MSEMEKKYGRYHSAKGHSAFIPTWQTHYVHETAFNDWFQHLAAYLMIYDVCILSSEKVAEAYRCTDADILWL